MDLAAILLRNIRRICTSVQEIDRNSNPEILKTPVSSKLEVMKIDSIFENCSYENSFLIEEYADSKIELRIEIDELVSLQSKVSKKKALAQLIKDEVKKIKWLITGPLAIEFHWYLSHHERHETDRSADLDNLNKPVLDSLTGEEGIMVDDSPSEIALH